MKSQKQAGRSSNPDSRFDVNRTLKTYQPNGKSTITTPRQSPNQPQVPEDVTPTSKKRFTWKKALLLLFIVVLTPLLVIGIWDYRNASGASEKLFGTSNMFNALLPTSLDATNGSTNILVIGYSADDPGHSGALLTDSILLMSLKSDKTTGFTMSIPRDLYVDIPDYGSAKINEAFQAGERQGFSEPNYEPGGTGLLQKTVEQTFGIKTHYTVIVNYGAVRDITDSVGGITVTIDSEDPRGIYDPNFKAEEGGPLTLTNGTQELDGQTALRLTRARGSTSGSYGFPRSDFNRTMNQQKVFAAIRAEITPSLLIDPRKNKPVFDAIADNLQTNLDIQEVIPLYRLVNGIPETNMKQVNLGDFEEVNYLSGRTIRGQSVLIPATGTDDFSEIQALLQRLSN